ncbi:MAG: HD-GYP domain-containing protein [Kangiella sp.]|jgi:putative nucleotidyltransferase with HDIG domain|nr:HD-GYP domain-containing protein [Kangiella sp.]
MKFLDKLTQWMGKHKSADSLNESTKRRRSSQSHLDISKQYQKLEKKKLKVTELQIGMTVIELDRPWTDVPIDFQEITIHTRSDIALLQQYCDEVYVDYFSYTSVTSDNLFHNKKRKSADFSAKQTSLALRAELPKAKKAFDRSLKHIHQLLDEVARDNQIDIYAAKEIIADCVDSILRNDTAMFWLSKVKNQDEYTAEHCLRVGILAIIFGKYMQLERTQLELLGLCGMLHDVGKMQIPTEVLNKTSPLTQDEFELIKQHTVLGFNYLVSHGEVALEVQQAAYNHHEHTSGNGYPRQISEESLSLYDRIIAIVDSYDAMTSDRCYRLGMPASQAVSILYNEQHEHYDSQLVQLFIQMVGIYPVGSLVKITNGQIAIVLSTNEDHKLEPVVELLTDPYCQLIQPIAIDLSKHVTDSLGNNLRIKRSLADNEVDFDLKSVLLRFSPSSQVA